MAIPSALYAVATAALLPEALRTGFGLRFGRRARLAFRALVATLSSAAGHARARYATFPAYLARSAASAVAPPRPACPAGCTARRSTSRSAATRGTRVKMAVRALSFVFSFVGPISWREPTSRAGSRAHRRTASLAPLPLPARRAEPRREHSVIAAQRHATHRRALSRVGQLRAGFGALGARALRRTPDERIRSRCRGGALGTDTLLLVPQLAMLARDSSAGHFDERRSARRWLGATLDALAREHGEASIARFRTAPIVLAAHSGGYLALLD